jgi:hypothetical protein
VLAFNDRRPGSRTPDPQGCRHYAEQRNRRDMVPFIPLP